MTKKHSGKISIPANTNVWEHELSTAKALANDGRRVEFLTAKESKHTKSPDIIMDGELWELKSPKTDKLSSIERNLKRASKQSHNVVLDSQRLRKLRDIEVKRFLIRKYSQQKSIKRLIFVNRKREVIDISKIA